MLKNVGIWVLNITDGLKIFVTGVSRGNFGGATVFLHGMSLWRMMSRRKLILTVTVGWLQEMRTTLRRRLANYIMGRSSI